jgi:hypothetical protein
LALNKTTFDLGEAFAAGTWGDDMDHLEGEVVMDPSMRADAVTARFPGGEEVETTVAALLISMILMTPLVAAGKTPTPVGLVPAGSITQDYLSAYLDEALSSVDGDPDVDYAALSEGVAEALRRLSELSGYFNQAVGNTISLWSLIQLMKEDPDFDSLIHFKVPDGLQLSEIESQVDDVMLPALIDKLKENDNCLRPYLLAETGVNVRQLGQAIGNIGLKPDLFGKVISHPINTNFVTGLRGIQDYAVLAVGARKAQITNQDQVKDAGYLTRKISLLVVDTDLQRGLDDCGTRHYVSVAGHELKTVARMAGRRYLGADGLLHRCQGDEQWPEDSFVQFRSPITCAGPRGVCETCYGESLARLNSDVHAGIFAMTVLTQQLTQMLLSSKHLLKTAAIKVDWPAGITSNFTVERHMMVPVTGRDLSLAIDPLDVYENDSGQKCLVKFAVCEKRNPLKREEVESPVELVLSERTEALLADNAASGVEVLIPFKSYEKPTKRGRRQPRDEDGDTPDPDVQEEALPCAFYLVTDNKEISSSLKAVKELLETKDHLGHQDHEGILGLMLVKLNESGIKINSVHIEMIMRAMVRNPSDLAKRPDFTASEPPPYVVLRVADAVMSSPSAAVSLAFEQVDRQLRDPSTFSKDGDSILDAVFLN